MDVDERRVSLVKELCRVFNAKPVAISCALRHGQISVDGYRMKQEYDRRWTQRQLQGRMAAITYDQTQPRPTNRQARLYE